MSAVDAVMFGIGEPEIRDADTPPDNPEITLACEDCGHVVTGKTTGRGSAAWKLGTHRYNKHGERTKSAVKARPNMPSVEELAESPIVATVQSMAKATGSRKGTPSGDDLAKGLGRGLQILTMGAAVYAAETDPAAQTTTDKDQIIDYLALPEKAAKDVMGPVGRMLAPTKLNQKYGRGVVDNVDVMASFVELGTMFMHWRNYFQMRQQALRIMAGQPMAAPMSPPTLQAVPNTPPPPVPAAPAAADPTLPAVPVQPPMGAPAGVGPLSVQHPSGLVHSPPPAQGRVMTAADVEAMRRG